MANIPQKSKDATDEALSAIEEALNIRAPKPRIEPRVEPPRPSEPATDFAQDQAPVAPVTADLFHADEPAPSWADENAPRQAANDDRANMGLILQALRRRRTRAPYVVASVAAAAWVAGGLATAYLSGAELQAVFATPGVGIAAMAGLTSAIVVPVIFFYVIAHMFSRSQDMRLVAESMAEVAMRLAQP